MDDLITNAGDVAAAAMRELPEALIVAFDTELRFILAAGPALGRLGNPPACREGQPLAHALPAEVWRPLEPLFRSALAGEIRSREVWTAGERHCLMVDVGPLRVSGATGASDEDTVVVGGLAVILDVTSRKRSDAIAQRPQADFAEVFERSPIGTGLLDLDSRWLLVNRALCEITGYTVDELIGKRFDGIVHPDDAYNDAEQRQRLLAGELSAYQVEKRYFDAAGETVAAMLSVSLVRDPEGAPLQLIVQMQDISARKKLEEDLRHLADHDPLTGLRNRRLFEHDLKLQVARSQRYGEQAALMVIHLDYFKRLNDEHGHIIADETLRAVARGLSRRLRQTDLLARLGGDEFAVLLPHADGEGAAVVADGLARVIRACGVDVGDDVLHPAASIGFALIDHRCASAEDVLAEAGRAMYAAKLVKAGQPA
ncbi:MAG TPA: diguanylate cyclase [Solirubrobacteraceae bacterium]|nr:diguanylate cyclase [Solirubrobacteraceae bacterium]